MMRSFIPRRAFLFSPVPSLVSRDPSLLGCDCDGSQTPAWPGLIPRWLFLFRDARPGRRELLLVVSRWHMMVGFLAISVVSVGNPSQPVIRRWWGRGLGESRKCIFMQCGCSFPRMPVELPRVVGSGSPLCRAFLSARRLSLTAPPLASLPGKDNGPKSPCRHLSPALASRVLSVLLSVSTCLRFASPHIDGTPAQGLAPTSSCLWRDDADDGLRLSTYLELMIDRSTSIRVSFAADNPRYLHCGPKCLPRHFAHGRSLRHGLICSRRWVLMPPGVGRFPPENAVPEHLGMRLFMAVLAVRWIRDACEAWISFGDGHWETGEPHDLGAE
ncbi:hypothetical protein V8C26DRAFT_87573 [Trichoderma gracile]